MNKEEALKRGGWMFEMRLDRNNRELYILHKKRTILSGYIRDDPKSLSYYAADQIWGYFEDYGKMISKVEIDDEYYRNTYVITYTLRNTIMSIRID